MKQSKKIGLALGSGGVRGLAHIGVIKSLLANGIKIDYISGSSIGAWVGAHFARYQNLAILEELTLGKKKEKLLSFLEPSFLGGLIGGRKTEKLLDDWLGQASFKDLKIPLKVVATDLVKKEQVVLDRGSVAIAAHASMAIPWFFKPVVFRDKILVDGGVCNPVPDDIVRGMGADIVIAVNLDNFSDTTDKKGDYGFMEVTGRSMDTMRHYLAKYSIKDSDIIIQPSLIKYSSWKDYFTKDNGAEIVQVGFDATEKIMPKLKKLLL
jgi:NTE family protein